MKVRWHVAEENMKGEQDLMDGNGQEQHLWGDRPAGAPRLEGPVVAQEPSSLGVGQSSKRPRGKTGTCVDLFLEDVVSAGQQIRQKTPQTRGPDAGQGGGARQFSKTTCLF